MFRGTELGKNLGVRQIISIAVIAVCLITLLTPWLYVGLRTSNGNLNADLEDLLEIVETEGYYRDAVHDFNRYGINFMNDDILTPAERKDTKTMRMTISMAENAFRNSKLSPMGTASICTNIAVFLNIYNKYDATASGGGTGLLILMGMVLWILILFFVLFGVRCILAELSGKKAPLAGASGIYLALFLLYIILTILVNSMQKKEMEGLNGFEALAAMAMGVEDPSAFHIRFAPILGSILLIGNLIIEKKGIFGETSGSVGVGMEAIGKKVIWKCSCGSVNPSGNRFCAKCGKARPADSAPLDFKTDVMGKVTWTCTCGNINPKKNAFCSKCGAMRPTDTVSTACCKMCGKPVTDGAELCRECLLKMSDTSRIRRPAPPERRAAETIAEKKAGTPADESRVRKTFRPPTSLD